MSNNLGRSELSDTQTNKAANINTQTGILDAALSELFALTVTGTDTQYTPSAIQLRENLVLKAVANDADPPVASTVNTLRLDWQVKKLYFVWNETAGRLDVELTSASDVSIEVGPGLLVAVYSTAQTPAGGLVLLAAESIVGAGDDALPYDVGGFFAGNPDATTILFSHIVARSATFPENFVNSQAHSRVRPDAQVIFDITKNTSNVGTLTMTSAGAVTFAAAGEQGFVAGDRLSVVSRAVTDPSIADISVTFRGMRS